MIVHETWTVCEGCGYRELGDWHPTTWVAMVDADGSHHFCSHACMLRSAAGAVPEQHCLPAGLTPADVAVLELAAQGLMDKQIGAAVGRSTSTIKNRLTQIRAKLGAHDRYEMVYMAHHFGVLNLNLLAQRAGERLKPHAA